jgi:hypothetical protein
LKLQVLNQTGTDYVVKETTTGQIHGFAKTGEVSTFDSSGSVQFFKVNNGSLYQSSAFASDAFIFLPKNGSSAVYLSTTKTVCPLSPVPVEALAVGVFTCGILASFCFISIVRWVWRG